MIPDLPRNEVSIMKKLFALTMATILLVGLAVSASAVNQFTASSGTCVVDGVKDLAYVSGPIVSNYDIEDGAALGTTWAAWDDEYLYLYTEVVDSAVTPEADVTSIWSNDCVEYYINLSGEYGAITDINAAQYTVGPHFTAWAGGGMHRENNMADAPFAFTVTDYGYTVEVAIPWGSDYTAKEGAVIDFCVGVNDDADGDASTREFQTFTGPDQTAEWSAADENMDKLTLSGEKYVEPEPETVAAPEVVDNAAAETVTIAPKTFDAGVIAVIAAVVSAAGYSLTKKR